MTTEVRPVDRDEVRRLLDGGAQLVDVMPDEEWDESHLPGAVHIPLAEIAERGPRELDPSRPVVVYCYDSL